MAVGLDGVMVGNSTLSGLDDVLGRDTAPLQLCGDKIGSRYAQRIVDGGCSRRTVCGSRNPYGQAVFIRYAGQFVKVEPLRGIRQVRRIEIEKKVDGSTYTFVSSV